MPTDTTQLSPSGIAISIVTSIVGGFIVATIALVLEYRTGWFAQYVNRKPQNERASKLSAKAVLYTFFGTWDRSATTLAFLLSIIAIVLTLVSIESIPLSYQLVLIRDCIFFVIALLLIGVMFSKYIRVDFNVRYRRRQTKNLQEKIDELNKQLKTVESSKSENFVYTQQLLKQVKEVIRNNKELTYFYFATYENNPLALLKFDDSALKSFRQICFYVTSSIRTSFIDLFAMQGINKENDVAVSVKLVIPARRFMQLAEVNRGLSQVKLAELANEDDLVITFLRDPYTYHNKPDRQVGGIRNYSIRRNTAFNSINTSQDANAEFFCNDLKGLGSTYINENSKWHEHYNSTHVVPIQYRDENKGVRMLFGFLAVDSLNPEKLNLYGNSESQSVLWYSADLLATFLLSLALQQMEENNQG